MLQFTETFQACFDEIFNIENSEKSNKLHQYIGQARVAKKVLEFSNNLTEELENERSTTNAD